jgi:hypothetical protein
MLHSKTGEMKLVIPIMVCWLYMVSAYAQKYSNEFLSIGIGARAQAMGTAVIAGGQDVTAGVWNPAGLAFAEYEISAMHAEWFGGIGKFDYAGIALPTGVPHRKLGISLIRFGIDQIPLTLSLYDSDGTVNYDNISEFSAADYALILSIAQLMKPGSERFSLGGNIKIIHRSIGPFANAWGFGADLGLQLNLSGWKLGLLVRDITTTFNAWSFSFTEEQQQVLTFTNNELPVNSLEITKPQLLAGITRRFVFGQLGLAPELNIIVSTDGRRNTLFAGDPFSLDPAAGLEFDYKSFVFLRAGISQFQRIPDLGGRELLGSRPAIGLGLKLGRLHVDYAYTDVGARQNTYSHIISLRLGLKKAQE